MFCILEIFFSDLNTEPKSFQSGVVVGHLLEFGIGVLYINTDVPKSGVRLSNRMSWFGCSPIEVAETLWTIHRHFWHRPKLVEPIG